jgi:hypothetical protein
MTSRGQRDEPDERAAAREERAAVRDAIRELFSASEVTNVHFQEVIARHPALLSERALRVVEDLAEAQTDPEGREVVRRLGAILARARVAGVEKAMLEFEDRTPDSRADRLEEERRRMRDARRGWTVRMPRGPDASLLAKGIAFESLGECLDHIRSRFPQGTVSLRARDAATDFHNEPPSIVWEAPRFLFRGESGLFPQTQSSLARVRADLSLSADTIETILAVSIRVRGQLVSQFELSHRLAAAFLQHYGLVTRFLDVSPDLDVAVQFATDLAVGDWGALAVMPVESLRESESFMLVDLTSHPMADRPPRQSAFALWDRAHSDLKDPEAIADRQLSWHWFRFTAEDEEIHQPDPYLLDAHSDKVAGLIGLLIDECARFDDGAAGWIARRVPFAPLVFRVTGRADSGAPTGILLSADEVGDDAWESGPESNYRKWSSACAGPDPPRGRHEVARSSASTAADLPMGAILRVLRSQIVRPPRQDAPDPE